MAAACGFTVRCSTWFSTTDPSGEFQPRGNQLFRGCSLLYRQQDFGVLKSWLELEACDDPQLGNSDPPQHSPTKRFQLLWPAYRCTARRISHDLQGSAAVHGMPARPRAGTADPWRQTPAASLGKRAAPSPRSYTGRTTTNPSGPASTRTVLRSGRC